MDGSFGGFDPLGLGLGLGFVSCGGVGRMEGGERDEVPLLEDEGKRIEGDFFHRDGPFRVFALVMLEGWTWDENESVKG